MSLTRWKFGWTVPLVALAFGLAGCGEKPVTSSYDNSFSSLQRAPGRIELEVLPGILPADGVSTATVEIRAFDSDGFLLKDQIVLLTAVPATAASQANGVIPASASIVNGFARVPFAAGSVPGTVTIKARAGRVTQAASITLVRNQPTNFVTSAPLAAGTTDTLDVAVTFTDDAFQRTGTPVAIRAIDLNGANLPGALVPASPVTSLNGVATTRLFLGPLSAEQQRNGVHGFIVTTIGSNTTLKRFDIAGTGSSGGGGGNQRAPTTPVSFTPSSIQFSVTNGTTLAIPLTAQFPAAANDGLAVFTLNPSFGQAAANGISGFFTPCPVQGPGFCASQRIPISSTGTASTTLVLTNIQLSQLGTGLVLAVNVTCSTRIGDVPFQFNGSAPVTLFPASPQLSLLSFSASPDRLSIPAGGSFSVTLTARVQAQDGSFPAGQFVKFTSDQSQGVVFPTTRATDASGIATATFSMNQVPSALLASGLFVTLRATAPGAVSGSNLSQTTSVFVTPSFGRPDHLVLSSSVRPNPTTDIIFVQGSAFPTVTQVTFDVLDINDNVARSATDRVQFVLENGGIKGGESLEPGAGTAPTTGALVLNGRASTVLRSGIRAGSVRIVAFIDNVIRNGRPDAGEPRSEPINISISGGLPSGQNLSVVPQFLNIAGLIKAGITDFIQTFLADRFNNPVIAGTRISYTSFDAFTLDSAAQVTASTATVGQLSQATATLVSQAPTPASGFVGVQTQTNAGVDSTVLSLAQDPARPNVIYAGGDGGGAYQGVFQPGFLPFGNMAWQNVGVGRTGLANGYVRSLAVDPRDGLNGVIYGGTERGLYRSTGSGGIWVERMGRGRIENERPAPGASAAGSNPSTFALAFPSLGQRARTIVIDNGDRRFDFVFDSARVIRFLASPTTVNPNPTTLRITYDYSQGIPDLVPITAIVVSPNTAIDPVTLTTPIPAADNAIVYAATLGAGIFRSTNGGFTWIPVRLGLSDPNVLSLGLAVRPTPSPAPVPAPTPDVVVLAGTQSGGVFKMTGGASALLGGNQRVVNEPAIFDAAVEGTLRWDQANRRLTATQILALATDPPRTSDGRPFRAYVGTDIGGVFRTAGNADPLFLFNSRADELIWAPASQNVNGGNLSNTRVTALAVDSATRNVFAATVDDDDPRNPIGGLFRSENNQNDAGNLFWPVANPLSSSILPLQNSRLRALAVGAGNLWVGGDGRQVWLSTNSFSLATATIQFTEVGRIGSQTSSAIRVNPQLDNNIYDTTRVLFSGSPIVRITPLSANPIVANGGFQRFLLTISDANGNPLPANTQICISSSPRGVVSGGGTAALNCPVGAASTSTITLSDTQRGGTDFNFDLTNDLANQTSGSSTTGDIGVTVRVVVTVLTPTGQILSTADDSVSRTLSSQQPLALIHASPPTDANTLESYTITGGAGPFLVTANTAIQPVSTGARTFTYVTPGNNTTFTLSVQDGSSGQFVQSSFNVPSNL